MSARSRDERGTVLVLVCVAMVMLIGSTALAVDIGLLTDANRNLQSVADVIALDAARALNGTSVAVLTAPSGNVTVAVQRSAARNNIALANVQVELGTKSVDSDFVAAANTSDVPTAVKVTVSSTVNYAFTPGSKTTSRYAVATEDAIAGFSAGSWLVGIADEHDTVLNTIFGDSFGAHVLSYNGLVDANVTFEAIGLEWPTGVLTPDEVLTTDVTLNDFLLASADVLRNQGDTAAANILDSFRVSMTSTNYINLGDIIEAETGGGSAAADAEVNVLQILTALAFVADGTHAISIPAAQLAIPNVGAVTLTLNVIEAPRVKLDARVGDWVHTAQVQATITPHLNISTTTANTNACTFTGGLTGLLGIVVSCVLGPVNKVISLNLNADVPINLEAAGATATLKAINCNAPQSITLAVDPIPLALTSNVDLTFTGTVAGVSLGNVLRVRGTATGTVTTTVADQVFLYPSQFWTPRSVGSPALGGVGLTSFTATNVTLLNANVTTASSVMTAAVLPAVNTALGSFDSLFVTPLNKLLGLSLGGADLTALQYQCDGVRLAE